MFDLIKLITELRRTAVFDVGQPDFKQRASDLMLDAANNIELLMRERDRALADINYLTVDPEDAEGWKEVAHTTIGDWRALNSVLEAVQLMANNCEEDENNTEASDGFRMVVGQVGRQLRDIIALAPKGKIV